MAGGKHSLVGVFLALDCGWVFSLDGMVLLVGGSLSTLYGLHLLSFSHLSLVGVVFLATSPLSLCRVGLATFGPLSFTWVALLKFNVSPLIEMTTG